MNALASENSSGCESGWTLYFEHSMDASLRDQPFLDENRAAMFGKRVADEAEDDDEEEEPEEEEDLSMVSDASSGPPHLHEELEEEECHQYQYHGGCGSNNGGGFNKLTGYHVAGTGEDSEGRRRKKTKKMGLGGHHHHASQLLDDTASSPFVNFFPTKEFVLTNNATPLRYPRGFSAADFEGNSALPHQFGISQPSLSSHQFQENQVV
ncbi:uncharacterized protein LOC116194794 [Punica granatum]|uniref:Uncharacterized protein LOC116194794 n=1 Tax=Punica granatum TaxID=22663 RepID=A0A6P8C9G1_PUNGR|nr:uncharacterized protein LOC116194794 [Punica granatum]